VFYDIYTGCMVDRLKVVVAYLVVFDIKEKEQGNQSYESIEITLLT
jgi:hypothetical protein